MNTNVSEIAHLYEDFLRNKMVELNIELDSSNDNDEETVRRAAFLARHNYVKLRSFRADLGRIQFAVQDAGTPTVTILANDEKTSCDCPMKKPCRHQLAALFTLYQYIDSLAGWLEDFRNKKNVQLRLLNEERTPESWLKLVQQVYRQNLYNQQKVNPFLMESIYADMLQQINRYTPLEREWSSMYQLFTRISLLSHTWKHLQATAEAPRSHYINFIEHEAAQLKELIRQSATKSRLFALDPFYEALQQVVNYFLLHQDGYFDGRLNIYTLFWEAMFQDKRSREIELAVLQTEHHFSADVDLNAVYAMFYIMLDKRPEFKQMLEAIDAKQLLVWTDLAHFANRNGYGDMLAMIVRAMLSHLSSFINEWLAARYRSSFVAEFNELCKVVDLTDEENEMLFAASGMYGIQPYSRYLIKQRRFIEWAALHQRFPSSLSYLELCGMRDVLDEKPEALLPLYHTLAMNEVNQKSRQHYKQAVRVWKKMKTAAKKSAKNEFWNDYVTTLKQSYKRLRALQEEIEKGNLML